MLQNSYLKVTCQRFAGSKTLISLPTTILHTPSPEIPDLAYPIHSLLRLLTQLLTLLRYMILQWFQPKWLSIALCIHGKTILLILLRLLICHHINVSKISNLSRGCILSLQLGTWSWNLLCYMSLRMWHGQYSSHFMSRIFFCIIST